MKRGLCFLSLVLLCFLIIERSNAQCPPVVTIEAYFPGSTFINGDNVAFCSGDSCKLIASPGSGVTYSWYKNGVLIPDATSNIFSPDEAGDFHVYVSGCPASSNIIHVTLNPLPTGSITSSPIPPVCSGTEVTVTLSTDLTSNTWQWLPPFTSQPASFTLPYYNSTNIQALILNNTTNCPRYLNYIITVHSTIDPGVISPAQVICHGSTPALLTGTPPSGGNGTYTYQWQSSVINALYGFTDIPGATNDSYQPGPLTQTTWFRRIVSSSSPCPSAASNTVQITVNPNPNVTSATTKSICSGTSVAYTPTANVEGATFTWTGIATSPGVTVSGVSPTGSGPINDVLTLDPGGTGNGEVTYTITPVGPAPTYCPGTPKNLVVTVKTLPVPVIAGPTPVCFGTTGSVYSTASGKSAYAWTIQGGVITAGQSTSSITVNWTTAGNQWVRVTYSENGCSAASPTQYDVVVSPLPVPVITGPNPVCSGSTGNVYSTAPGMTDYGWTVSSGGTITGGGGTGDNTVTVTWNTPGIQWVRVSYTDANGCRNSSPAQFNVNVSTPSLNGPSSACLGSSNSTYSTESGMTNYVWTVSTGGTITSGGTSTSATAVVTWNTTGTQWVGVNYTTPAGCAAMTPTTKNVTVNPLPVPGLSGNTNVCEGSTGIIYTTESGKSFYTWTISSGGTITGGGTAISNSATVTWNSSGPQWIKVNYTDANGCTAVSPTQYDVTVKPLPVPVISGSNSECVGKSGIIYSTEGGKSNYSWSISGGIITAGNGTSSVTVTWTTAGSGWVAVNYTDINGCNAANPTQFPVTVKNLPVPSISGSSSVCINALNVAYTTEAGMTNYSWSVSAGGTISGGGTSSDNTVYITWNSTGTQTVSVSYTGTNGCPASSPVVYNVMVNPLPVPSLSGTSEACLNSAGNVYTTQPGMSNYVWSVSPGGTITSGGTTTSNTATVTWNSPGSQNVSVNYSQTGCPATSPTVKNVTVNPLPTADAGFDQLIPYGTSTTLTGTAGGGTPPLSYIWDPASSINGSNTNLTVQTTNITTSPTVFTITVTDSKGCSVSDNMTITLNGSALSVTATATPDTICDDGASVQLNAVATGGNSQAFVSYEWKSTPPGFTSAIQNPVVNPEITTTYHITVYDKYNYSTNSVIVTVHPLPTVFTVTGGGEYCNGGIGLPIGLSGSQTGVNYQLSLYGTPDGAPVSGTNSALSFGNKTNPGTYTVQAVDTTTGCQQTMNGNAVVTVNPVPTAYAGPDQVIPHGVSTTLAGAASGGTAPLFYLWNPVTMIKSGETTLAPITWNIYATQEFTLTVSDSKGCSKDDTVEIQVNGSALSALASVSNNPICDGSPDTLSATGTGGSGMYTFLWECNPPGTPAWSSTEQNPVVTPSENTLYTVTINDGYNTASSSVSVLVNPLPASYVVTGGGCYCSGGSGVLVGLSGTEVGVYYYLYWNNLSTGTIIPGTGTMISFGYQLIAGSYTVKAKRVLTGCENTMSGSVTVTILPLPDPFTVTGGGSYPAGGVGVPVGLSGSQTGINYRVILNSTDTLTPLPGVPGTGSPVTFGYQTDAGQYTAVGKNAATGCIMEMLGSVNVIINPYPSLFNVFGGGTICLNDLGKNIGLDGSEMGIRYVLKRGNDSIAGFPASGDTIHMGVHIIPGIYTVEGVNIATGLRKIMNGNAPIVVNPLPVAFLMIPQGDTCPGTEILLNGSESGITYYLIRDNDTLAVVPGTGLPGLLSFGHHFTPGLYHVVGINSVTNCKNDMTGSTNIQTGPAVFILNPPGIICPGQELILTGSETGMNYQLRRDSLINVGSPVAGTGSPLNFGQQLIPGFYRVVATDPVSHCYSWQAGRPVIQPGPSVYSMLPAGDTCAGGLISLNGSQIGINYHIILNGTIYLDSLYGTGSVLYFGPHYTAGNYRILGVDTLTHCQTWMDGELNLLLSPTPYQILPDGVACAGWTIGLEDSETGVEYTLIRDGSVIAAGPVSGTGNPISFGIQTNPGNYTVEAMLTATGCSRNMTGMTSLLPRPTVFSINPQGPQCAGTIIYLNGSQTGISYELMRDNVVQQTIAGTGNILTFGAQTIPGIYTIRGVNFLTTCDTFMNGSTIIIPLPQAHDITPAGANCSPTVVEISGSETGVNYQLIKNHAVVGSPLPGTGTSLSFGLQTDGIYQVVATELSTNCADTMPGEVIISPGPDVMAGNDTSICSTSQLILDAHAYNFSTVFWATSGDGVFSDNTQLNTIYTPGTLDKTTGSVTLIVTVTGSSACQSTTDSDSLTLGIISLPVVNAGNDETICSSETYTLIPTIQNYSVLQWSTSGDGIFNNVSLLNPVYTPGPGDIASGSVLLTVKAYGVQQCSQDFVTDAMTLTLEPVPVADAGTDAYICENSSILLSGSTQNSSSVQWSTTGDGFFLDPTELVTTYTPGNNDKQNGYVKLILEAIGLNHCSAVTDLDTVQLFIQKLPVADAGLNDTICANQQALLHGTAQFQSSVQWITTGDGIFGNSQMLNTTYTPGSSDIATGNVSIVLSAIGVQACLTEFISDTLILSISPMPVANAGNDTLACPDSILLNGSGLNFTSVLWTSLGDGIFDDPSLLKPLYTPGNNDKLQGSVFLLMTLNGVAQCMSQISTDTMQVVFKPVPTAAINGTSSICEGENANLVFNLSGTAPWRITYTDGTNTYTVGNIPSSPYSVYVTPSMTTTYSLLMVEDANCHASPSGISSFTIQVFPGPNTYQMTGSNGNEYCEGDPGVEIGIDGSQSGISYHLIFEGTPIGNPMPGSGLPISFGWQAIPGIYKVLALNPSTLCEKVFPDSIKVILNLKPEVDFTTDSVCFGTLSTFDINGNDIGKIAFWEWDYGDGTVETFTAPIDPTHLYQTTGNFQAVLTATDTNGCTRIQIHNVHIGTLPTALYSTGSPACAGMTVSFTDHSYPSNPTYLIEWHWDFGDGQDTTIYWPGNQNIMHRYQLPGTYNSVLTIKTNEQCTAQKSLPVIIIPPPVANYTFQDTRCKLEPVHFTDLSQPNGGGSIVQWYWNFNDPLSGAQNISHFQSPVHIFSGAATYDVMLIITNINNCQDTIMKSVTISDVPLADFSADTACKGSLTHFSDLSVPNEGILTAWDWNFGDGTPHSNVQNPDHNFSGPGIYTVTLLVTNSSGCTDAVAKQIKVNEKPVAAFSNSITNCMGSPVSFTDLSTPVQGYLTQWIWDFGDGTDTTIVFPNLQNVTHIYPLGGQYNVMLTVQNSNGCSASISHIVTVAHSPIANFEYAATRCAGSAIQFTDISQAFNGVQITGWSWNFGDPTSGVNNISSLQNPVHVYQAAGTYDVLLTVTNVSNCTDTIVKSMVVNGYPTVQFSADTVCNGNTTHFTDGSVANSGNIIAWEWTFGDGGTSSQQNPSHFYSDAGTFNVTLTVTNSMLCLHDTTQHVQVKIRPEAMFSYSDNCMASLTQFVDESYTAEGQINQWFWDFGDGATSILQNPSHIFAAAGTYNVMFTVTSTLGCLDSITIPVVIYPKPTASFASYSTFCPAGEVTFADHSIPAGSPIMDWFWIFENGFYATVANPTYTFSQTDTIYPVTLIITDANGCHDTIVQDVEVVPGFSFTFRNDTVCFGTATHFLPVNRAEGDTLHDLKWNFGDPASGTYNTSSLYYPEHTYTNPGTYIVKLLAYNSNNCVDSIYREVIVNPGPVAEFTFDTIPYCDRVVLFRNQSFGNGVSLDSLLWDFGDGNTEVQIAPIPAVTSHQYGEFGDYTVSVTAVNANGCRNTIQKSLLVACVNSAFTVNDTLHCANQPVILTDSSAPVALMSQWQWDFGDSKDTLYTEFVQTLSHRYDNPGTFKIVLVVTSVYNELTISDTSEREISIRTSPSADFLVSPVCLGDTSRFINLSDSNNVTIVSNLWEFGDPEPGNTDTSSLVNPEYFYKNSGKYGARLIVTNKLGCADTIKQTAKVNKLPVADFVSSKACSRDYVQFTDLTTPGDTTLVYWLWTFGDPSRPFDSLSVENPAYVYPSEGLYDIFLKVGDQTGCQDTVRKQITVLESPISAFTIIEDFDGIPGKIKLNNTSMNASGYEWDFGNGKKSNEEDPIIMYDNDGTYVIQLITWNDNECSDTTLVDYEFMYHNLYVPNAFSPTNIIYDLRLFKPVGINLQQYHVQVFDVQGHLLWESNTLDDKGKPLEGWDGHYEGALMPQGTYMWKIEAVFKDGKNWEGSDIGKGTPATMGTVTLIR